MAENKVKLPSRWPKAKENLLRVVDPRNAFYLESDPRRRIDNAYGNQINSDMNAFANCPPKGFQRYFPGRDLTGVKE